MTATPPSVVADTALPQAFRYYLNFLIMIPWPCLIAENRINRINWTYKHKGTLILDVRNGRLRRFILVHFGIFQMIVHVSLCSLWSLLCSEFYENQFSINSCRNYILDDFYWPICLICYVSYFTWIIGSVLCIMFGVVIQVNWILHGFHASGMLLF